MVRVTSTGNDEDDEDNSATTWVSNDAHDAINIEAALSITIAQQQERRVSKPII
jgi:hypothetical protein